MSINRATNKVIKLREVVERIKPTSLILSGGFGACGVPNDLLQEISLQKIGDLHVVSSIAAIEDYGVSKLIGNGLITHLTTSYTGNNKLLQKRYLDGDLHLYLSPQGTIAEKIRSGGKGIPAFWTRTGAFTMIESGGVVTKYHRSFYGQPELFSVRKESRYFNNNRYILEDTIYADFALIKAHKADKSGNLQFRRAARNFNQDMAFAAKTVIVEAEIIVEVAELNPDDIHVPGPLIDYVVQSSNQPKPIEIITNIDNQGNFITKGKHTKSRELIAKRASQEIIDGCSLNLGIGIPTLIPSYISKDVKYTIHSENGVIGVEGFPLVGEEDPDLINAGKESITISKRASFTSSSDSFGIVRGGHLNMTILGAMEVSQYGDLANWIIPGKSIKGMGGAMDLVSCDSTVIVAMEHNHSDGTPKILEKCALPITGHNCVSSLITELGVFTIDSEKGMTLIEISKNTSLSEIKQRTACSFEISPFLRSFG